MLEEGGSRKIMRRQGSCSLLDLVHMRKLTGNDVNRTALEIYMI